MPLGSTWRLSYTTTFWFSSVSSPAMVTYRVPPQTVPRWSATFKVSRVDRRFGPAGEFPIRANFLSPPDTAEREAGEIQYC